MEINGVEPQGTPSIQYEGAAGPAGDGEETVEGPSAGEGEESGAEQVKGVLRLLQEGHFKGVADVRLRINFFEELKAMESEQLQAAAGAKVDNVVQSVTDGVNAFVGSGESSEGVGAELTEEESAAVIGFKDIFCETANQLKEEFVQSESPLKEVLIAGLESAFDGFVESVRDLFSLVVESPAAEPDGVDNVLEGAGGDVTSTGTVEQPAVGDAAGVEPAGETAGAGSAGDVEAGVAESGVDVESFIAGLTADFEAAMAELIEALNGVMVLPELSEPSGNGTAYDKFVAIYNELRGFETGAEESTEGEPLDSVG